MVYSKVTHIHLSNLRQLPRHERMSRAQSSTNSPRLPIHVAALIAPQEQSNARDLVRNRTPLQRVQLPDLPLRATRPRHVIHRLRHTRLNDTWTNRVDADACACKLVRAGLCQGDNCCFGRGVICRTRVGAQARNGGGHDYAAGWVGFLSGGDLHGESAVFGCQEGSACTSQVSIP